MTHPWTKHLVAEISDGIGWLILNQPEKRNAMSFDMWRDLPGVLRPSRPTRRPGW